MDMSFWFYVLERRGKIEQERKAKTTLISVCCISIILILVTLLINCT